MTGIRQIGEKFVVPWALDPATERAGRVVPLSCHGEAGMNEIKSIVVKPYEGIPIMEELCLTWIVYEGEIVGVAFDKTGMSPPINELVTVKHDQGDARD